jgi:hypothetical protein
LSLKKVFSSFIVSTPFTRHHHSTIFLSIGSNWIEFGRLKRKFLISFLKINTCNNKEISYNKFLLFTTSFRHRRG